MRKFLPAVCAIALLIPMAYAYAQVGGGPPANGPNVPFGKIDRQTWGRAITNAIDPQGSDPDQEYDPFGPDKLTVDAMSNQGPATAVCNGEAELTYSPLGLICESVASGYCNMASNTDPQAATRSEFNCRTLSELGSKNASMTETFPVIVRFVGYRNAESMDEKTVEGWGQVLIKRADGTEEKYRVEVVPKGWKKQSPDEPYEPTEDFNWQFELNLAPGDSVGIASAAEVRTYDVPGPTGPNGKQYANGDTYANLGLKVSVVVKPQENGPPPPPPGP